MKKSGLAALGLAGLLGLNGGCLAVAVGSLAYVEGKEREAESRIRAAEIEADAYRQVHRAKLFEYGSTQDQIQEVKPEEMTTAEFMGYAYGKRISVSFVCSYIDMSIDGAPETADPIDYVGIDKTIWKKSEKTTLGMVNFDRVGSNLEVELIGPRGNIILHENSKINRSSDVSYVTLEDENKEVGRNVLITKINGVFQNKIEFDITE